MSMHCQSCSNLVPIQWQSDVNTVPIFQSHVDSLPIWQSTSNSMPIQFQSCVNPIHSFKSYRSSPTIQSIPNPMSIQCPSRVNPALIKHQSSTTLMSIQYINMASIWSQSNAKPMSIKTNQLPIHCKYNAIQMSIPTIVCQSVSIRRRSDVNQMPVQCRSYPNSLPIRFQFSANPVPI